MFLPERARTYLDIIRRYPIWKRKEIIFIHVPKVAGVSVNKAIFGKPLGHFQAYQIQKIFPFFFKNTFSFGLVRHPLSRLISSYHFAKSGGTSIMKIQNPKQYKIPAFENFDRFVMEWLQFQNFNNIDGVFRPQFQYLCKNQEIIVNQVIPLESIKNGEIILNNKLHFTIGHYNETTTIEEIQVSPQTLKVVKELYHLDYSIFGYEN